MKRILVTGGAGFVGSHLCDRLIQDGHTVLCVDNLRTGAMENIRHLDLHPQFVFLNHDVREIDGRCDLLFDVEEIYNLACPASPVHYQKDPIFTVETCVLGAINLLDVAKATKARVLQASTSEVYGDPLEHPQRETYRGNVNPLGPRSCYDEGKRIAESIFCTYHERYGVDIRIARIFNTYGPRMDRADGRVVSNFIVAALEGRPLEIYGDGSQTRSFCYVEDLVEGLISLMATPEYVGPVNLGNPGEFTVKELADLVLSLTGSASELAFLPLPQDDPTRRRPDIAKAAQLCGFRPSVALKDGLERTVSYFR